MSPAAKTLDLQRVNIVGTAGSGKSTFARKLAARLNQPYIQMDQLFWLPNWTEPSDEVFFAKVSEAVKAETWVLDGNFDRTFHIKGPRTTCTIWLDFSRSRTVWQVTWRALKRAYSGQELWPDTGNRESLRRAFLDRRSIILWTLTSYDRLKQRYEKRMKESKVPFVRLRSPKEAEKFLSSL